MVNPKKAEEDALRFAKYFKESRRNGCQSLIPIGKKRLKYLSTMPCMRLGLMALNVTENGDGSITIEWNEHDDHEKMYNELER
jgi:hypothetical protein